MKLEYIPSINPNFQNDDLIRLFDFDRLEAEKFQNIITDYLLKKRRSVELTDVDFIEGLNCSLNLKLREHDKGIHKIGKDNFVCELTLDSYHEMVELIQPFVVKELHGFQWLYDLDPKVSTTEFLFSPKGSW